MGRWSAAHRKTAILGWLAFVVIAFAIGIVSPMTTIDDKDRNVGEAGRADKIVQQAFDVDEEGLVEFVVVQSDTLTADDPAFRATVRDVIATVDGFDEVTEIDSPYSSQNDGQISPDRHAAMVMFTPTGDLAGASKYIDEIVGAVDGVQAEHPDFVVAEWRCGHVRGLTPGVSRAVTGRRAARARARSARARHGSRAAASA
jgi:RND superfamily putative drug exporter